MWTYNITSRPQTHYSYQSNAREVYEILRNDYGFTEDAAIGVIANMEHESYINPGQQEIGYGGSVKRGYGLVQWTPADTKILAYADSVGGNWYDGTVQMQYFEINVPASWIDVTGYSYNDFKLMTDPYEAAYVFFKNFERGTWHNDINNYVSYWYDVLVSGDDPPTPPTPPTPPPPAEDETIAMYIVSSILKWFT